MTIRAKLLALIAVLGVMLLVVAGHRAMSALDALRVAEQVRTINGVSDRLLAAAGAWAVERGTTNTMLSDLKAASAAQKDTVAAKRRAADAAYADALRAVTDSSLLPSSAKVAEEARTAFAKVEGLRRQVDEALARGEAAAELRRDWFPSVSALIVASQRLRGVVEDGGPVLGASVRRAFELKNALWEMSEYAGRERGMVGGVVAGGKPFTPAQLETVARARGHVESGWTTLRQLADGFGPRVGTGVTTIERAFFGEFEATRVTVFDASAKGQAYPVNGAQWFAAATAGIDRILEAQQEASGEVQALLDGIAEAARADLTVSLSLLLAVVLIAALAAWVITVQVNRPLHGMTKTMTVMAEGRFDMDVPGAKRNDEIGEMARAVLIFRQHGIENERLRAEQERLREASENAKRAALAYMADSVEREMRVAVEQVAAQTRTMDDSAQSMSDSAGLVSVNAQSVAAAAEQGLASARSAAAAVEEMSASIRSIADQIGHASDVTRRAVGAGRETQATIETLSAEVARIGDVAKLISGIASQTNLLALNATIEAARAGEAGKGFAVVATEVKNLANQTAAATEEIATQIAAVQASTGNAVQAVRGIGATLDEVDSIAGEVAAVMSQQDATTGEILNAVVETSKAAHEVSERIARVSTEAAMNGENADGVRGVAAELAKGVASLSGTLIRAVRTATQEVDRRLWPRYAVDRPCRFDTAEGSVTTLRLLDLSQRGARIATAPPLAAGTRGKLSIEGYPHPLAVVSVTSRNGELHLRFNLSDAEQSAFDVAFPKLIAGARELDAAS